MVSLPPRITPLPANIFPYKLAPNVGGSIPRNPHVCSFNLFSTGSLTPFINKPVSFRDLTIFIVSSICSFESTIVPSDKRFVHL